MKKILSVLFILVSLVLFLGCDIDFNFTGSGSLKIENNSNNSIKAFVMYEEVDGEYVEAYRNDGVYGEEGSSPANVNIKSGEYKIYSIESGSYDIWLFTTHEGYWYYTVKEDVYVYSNNTTTITVEAGQWTRLIPSKASSIYNKLPEIVKKSVFIEQ